MRLPFWGYEVRYSTRNGLILVSPRGEVVAFGAKQTSARYEEMWSRAIKNAELPHASQVLMLGFAGGGSVASVYKAYPGCMLVCVEYDEAMVDIGKRLISRTHHPMPRIVIADATEALHSADERFDLILVDLFVGARPSPLVSEASFWELVRERLSPAGRVILNVAGDATRVYTAQKHFKHSWTWQDRYNTFCVLSPERKLG